MVRRHFIRSGLYSLTGLGLLPAFSWLDKPGDLVIGHENHRYKIDLNWGALHSAFYPVKDAHEMVQDSQGRIILLTNHVKNNVIIYNKAGQLQEVWGTDYPGAHGLTLHHEGGEDFLYITDTTLHVVIKTTMSGQEVMRLSYPAASGKYDAADQYLPTETAVAPNGDIYVADGYGLQYILHYNAQGELLNIFGGRGTEAHHFENAHGICIDDRNPKDIHLLITARQQQKLKAFSLDGTFRKSYHYPGAFICRPVIHNKEVYLATIWSGDGRADSGFISILNEKNEMVAAPGGSKPVYENGKLLPMYQTQKIFRHPHDVCVDEEGNLYVAQWNSDGVYPIKLLRQSD